MLITHLQREVWEIMWHIVKMQTVTLTHALKESLYILKNVGNITPFCYQIWLFFPKKNTRSKALRDRLRTAYKWTTSCERCWLEALGWDIIPFYPSSIAEVCWHVLLWKGGSGKNNMCFGLSSFCPLPWAMARRSLSKRLSRWSLIDLPPSVCEVDSRVDKLFGQKSEQYSEGGT